VLAKLYKTNMMLISVYENPPVFFFQLTYTAQTSIKNYNTVFSIETRMFMHGSHVSKYKIM